MISNKLAILVQKIFNDDFHFFLKGENLAHWKYFKKYLRLCKKDILVDLGGGKGYWTKKFAPFVSNVIFIDGNKKDGDYCNSVLKAKKSLFYKNIDFILADIQFLPLKKNIVNKILINQVLEHVSSPSIVFKEAERILIKNGVLVNSTPYSPFIIRYKFPLSSLFKKLVPFNFRRFSSDFLIGDFAKNGYYNWMKKVGHLNVGFNLLQLEKFGKESGLICTDYNFIHQGAAALLWELSYTIPIVSFLIRPFSIIIYKLKEKSNQKEIGVDLVCQFKKIYS